MAWMAASGRSAISSPPFSRLLILLLRLAVASPVVFPVKCQRLAALWRLQARWRRHWFPVLPLLICFFSDFSGS